MASGTTRQRRSLVSIAVGLVLGLAGTALPSFDALWDGLGVARDLRAGHSTALAIVFLCLGFLVALYFQQEELKAEVADAQRAELARFVVGMPKIDVFRHQSGEEAMEALTTLIATARTAANTRISPSGGSGTTRHGASSPWDTALREAIMRGLTYREVVSHNHADLAKDRRASTAGARGVYEVVTVRQNSLTFLNFIVLEQFDGSKEVWFGWLTSRTTGFEGPVVRTSETRIISMFERWHSDLLSAGRSL